MSPSVSVLVATRNRGELLQRMLTSLDECLHTANETVQVILVDSASTDDTLRRLHAWSAIHANSMVLHLDLPGKSRALNAALKQARGDLLLFTDDDVELAPNWIDNISNFFERHSEYAAAMGCIRVPPYVVDHALLERARLYGTLPLYDHGPETGDVKHLYGCNMAVRRTALLHVGPFHEALGPGASGLHEDGDLARRILRAGLRIGYMPDAMVYHAVEEDRLSLEFFREMHRRDARSRYVMDPGRGFVASALHWLGAAAGWLWWSLLQDPKRQMKALGRLESHSEMLRLVRKRAQA